MKTAFRRNEGQISCVSTVSNSGIRVEVFNYRRGKYLN